MSGENKRIPQIAYLALGQSNMVFRGIYGEENDGTSPETILFMNNAITDSDQGEVLSEQVPWNWRYSIKTDYYKNLVLEKERGNKAPAGLGPQYSFALKMQKYHNKSIGMIDSAIGGESIESYRRGKPLYEASIKRAKKAIADGAELKGIIWHQGERNCMGTHEITVQYAEILKEVVNAFREDLGMPNLPFIAGELGYFFGEKENIYGMVHPDFDLVQEQLHLAETMIDNFVLISAEGLESRGDELHFNSAAYEELGNRYADAMQKLLEK